MARHLRTFLFVRPCIEGPHRTLSRYKETIQRSARARRGPGRVALQMYRWHSILSAQPSDTPQKEENPCRCRLPLRHRIGKGHSVKLAHPFELLQLTTMSLQDFQTIGKGVSIYKATLQQSNKSDGHYDSREVFPSQTAKDQPALIIICTWLGGATSKRIQRYTRGYNKIWPKANLLLIRTEPMEYAFLGARSLARKLLPALGEIRRATATNISDQSASASSPSPPGNDSKGILMHIFSNGGANIATQLVTSTNNILSLVGEHNPLELRQIVFDSCPGDPDINATYHAASKSLPPSHLLRPLGCAILYLVVAGIAGLEAVGIRKKLGKTMRAQFNDPNVFDKEAWRLYLTSKADVMVDTLDVQAHRDQALEKGLRTHTVVFERAGHCSLVLEDEITYWGTIAAYWEQSGSHGATSCTKQDESGRHGVFKGRNAKPHISQVRSRL